MVDKIDNIIESFVKENPSGESNNTGLFYPYFTMEETKYYDGYYSDNINEEYKSLYKEMVERRDNSDIPKSWNDKVTELELKLKNTNNPEEIDQIKQDLVTLGWNPEVDYNIENQIKAKSRYISLTKPKISIDNVLSISESIIEESSKDKDIYPISIVTVKGDAPISNIITGITKGDFSHAAICLDKNLKKLYSFNFDNKINRGGGFSMESIKDYPKNNRLAIYTIFVSKEAYDKINENIQYFMNNVKNTSYSLITLISFPFNNISIENDASMICSQFVDSMLKLANINITDLSSSKVSPNKLYFSITKNPKAFKIFDGKVKDFDDKRAEKRIDRLISLAKPVNESMIIPDDIHILTEAKSLPIEINGDDILLTNPFPNFESEYFASHKLLINYEKTNNIDGMKYELARLYYMNYILEKKLYHNKILMNKKKNIDTRARILNDFNKYLKYVNKRDKSFNFSEYYEKSPFYAHTIRVPKETLGQLKNVISYIL